VLDLVFVHLGEKPVADLALFTWVRILTIALSFEFFAGTEDALVLLWGMPLAQFISSLPLAH